MTCDETLRRSGAGHGDNAPFLLQVQYYKRNPAWRAPVEIQEQRGSLPNTHNSSIPLERLNASLVQWLGGYELTNSLKVIENAPESLSLCKSEFDRFVQYSDRDDLLYSKTRGIINRYLNDNREDLESLFEE